MQAPNVKKQQVSCSRIQFGFSDVLVEHAVDEFWGENHLQRGSRAGITTFATDVPKVPAPGY
jgi:hypothetical protein